LARINIEDSIYADSRYINLIIKTGNEYLAKGMLWTAWQLAQKYWLKYGGIPQKHWPESLNILIEVGLARTEALPKPTEALPKPTEALPKPTETLSKPTEALPNGILIYVAGSTKANEFLSKMSLAGKIGGKSKNPKKLKNLVQYQKPAKNTETLPKPTEISFSSSNSFSSSIYKNKNISFSKNTNYTNSKIYFEIQKIYEKLYPQKGDFDFGFENLIAKGFTESDLRALECAINAYNKNCEVNGREGKFIRSWRTWTLNWKQYLDPETGTSKDFSQKVEDNYERAFEKIRLAEEQRLQKEKEQNVSG
jgi:hypothetical protein